MSAMLGGVAKLFSNSKKKAAFPKESSDSKRRAQQLLHPGGLSVPKLNPNRLRVVVFRDDKGIKHPIFDSQQFSAGEEGEEHCTRSLCDMRHGECLEASLSASSNGGGGSSTHSAGWATHSSSSRRGLFAKRPSTDSELLGEMMFGSMPMKVVGNTVKVHYIRSTDQLMVSKVFTSQRKALAHCTITDLSDSCPLPNSSPSAPTRSVERSFRARSKNPRQVSPDVPPSSATLSVPIGSWHPPSSSSSSPSSSHPSPPSPLNSLPPSLSRRIQRSRSTSLENASVYRKVLKPLDQPSSRMKRKYAISFIICLSELSKPDIRHVQSFLFSHFTLIDAHLERLKIGVEEAYYGRSQGVLVETVISKAYETFLQDFLSLYSAPRIESPVWLSLVSHVDRRKEVCVHFMEELASAIVELDTKETKFFLSSLLTAVLSHHLAWIFTVTPSSSSSSPAPSSDSANRHGKQHHSKSLGVLAESHPYNPLWAQLGDLFGSVSHPLKISRTVVTGHVASVVCRLLYLLTYFIRCSEVEPGFTMLPETASPHPSSAAPTSSRTPGVTIPSSASNPAAADSASSYDVSQLDETEMCGSRASSVTVISENDRHSLLSPFASPVNHQGGQDTPIIRPHPFGIRTTPLSLVSPSDYRKGSQSESDSGDSFTMRGSDQNIARLFKKTGCTGDLSTSQGLHDSPLLSSARETGLTRPHESPDYHPKQQQAVTVATDHARHQCTCATLACCESMGMCPLADGFLTFDPNCNKPHPQEMENRYSPSHLAACSVLDPAHSLGSTFSAPPSCSSLDSGSWSLTNSSLASSFSMVCSNKNHTGQCAEVGSNFGVACSNKNHPRVEPPASNCEIDFGRGSQCSYPQDIRGGCRRTLFVADNAPVETPTQQSCHDGVGGGGGGFGLDKCCSLGGNNSGSNGDVRGTFRDNNAPPLPKATDNVSPHHSHYQQQKETSDVDLPSPLSPDPSDKQLSLDVLAVSADPLAPLPSRKLKNHIRTITQAQGSINLPPSAVDLSYEVEPAAADSVQDSLDPLSLLRHRAKIRANSSPPLLCNQPPIRHEDEEVWSMGGASSRSVDVRRSFPMLSSAGEGRLPTESGLGSLRGDGLYADQSEPVEERSLHTSLRGGASMKSLSEPPSMLHQQLHQHDRSLRIGARPSTLEQFDNFTDVPLPDLEDFHLDTPTHGGGRERAQEESNHRHQMSDFGHSLFVGLSPRYLPDFVLHGTTESANQAFQDKLLKDLAHTVKYSIIDEPVEYGVGIVADTDTWTVKILAASKSLQTTDLIYGSGVVQAANCVRQMLSSIKNMHSLRMPAEFCLSYVEDSLMSLNDRSIMLADSLLEKGDGGDFSEILPKVAENLSISPSDVNLLLPVAAVNCQDPNMAARFNYLHMQQTLGKHFI